MIKPGEWIKSSRSDSFNQCVEVRYVGVAVLVRDSKDPHGPVLAYHPRHWARFLDAVRAGEITPDAGALRCGAEVAEGAHRRHRSPGDPAIADAERELRIARILSYAERAREMVADIDLTDEQRATLAANWRPVIDGQ